MTPRAAVEKRWARWWLDELPPLDGRLRLVVYGGLFVLALTMWKSPLRAVLLYAQTDPILYRAEGLMAALRLPWLPPWVLQVAVVVTAAAWICTAIGLLGRTSAVVTAVGAFTIHGYCWASSAYNHNWYLAVYVLIALCFAAPDPEWSVDAAIRRRRGRPPLSLSGLGGTGFPRVLALVFTAAFYFCAGVTKLQESGLGWLDGHTIAYWSEEDASKRILAKWLGERMWLCAISAWFTLFFEAGAPLALISRRLRPLFVLGWIAMHVGIRLTMGPRYFENILLFVLLLDWTAVRAHGAKGFVMRLQPAALAEPGRRPRTLGERAAPKLGTLVLAGVLAVVTFQIAWWPVSNVYMYSAYYSRSNGVRAGEPHDAYRDPIEAQRIARRFHDETVSFDAKEYLPRLFDLRLVGRGVPPLDLPGGVGTPTAKQWELVIELPVVVADLAGKPRGRIEYDPARPEAPANRFLREILPVIRSDVPEWKNYERAELVYDVEDADVVIASVPLGDGDP